MKKAIAVFLRPGSHWDRSKPVREQALWDEHAHFVDALYDQGKVMLAGPFADGTGSLVIMTVDTPEAARAIYQEDPWAVNDILVAFDAKEWTIFLDSRDQATQAGVAR